MSSDTESYALGLDEPLSILRVPGRLRRAGKKGSQHWLSKALL